MNWQLRIFVFLFLVPSFVLYFRVLKQIPTIQREEDSWSREFWMFIGALVLFLASVAIIVPTSFPIINKVFHTNLAIGADQEFSYNRVQVFVAIIIGILTASVQYLRYKNTPKKTFFQKILWPTLLSAVITLTISLLGDIHYDKFGIGFLAAIHLALFASIYAVIANAFFIRTGLNNNLKAAGSAITHIGFGLFLVGVLISSAKKEVLSINKFNPVNFGNDSKEKGEENLTLFRGIRTDMGSYWATYVDDSSRNAGKFMYFHIRMEQKDGKEAFDLYPDLIKNTKGQEGYSNNPDAKHYWNRDIFSYISYADKMLEGTDTSQYRNSVIGMGDTLFYSRGYLVLDTVGLNLDNDRVKFSSADTAVMARLRVISFDKSRPREAAPYLLLQNNQLKLVPDTVIAQNIAVRFNRITTDQKFDIGVKESSRLTPFVTLKVLKFPYINLVWLGTLIMIAGFILSLLRRMKLI
jgi:cytochrome c-type biogenesis protein CcmF